MKTRYLFLYLLLFVFSTTISAQNIINNGATITIVNGTSVTVSNGGYYNLTNGPNHGQIDLNGNLYISGDFVNQATDPAANVFINVGTDGRVYFNGSGTQHIYNTTSNAFINFEDVYIAAGSTTLLDEGSAATVNGSLFLDATSMFRLSSPNDGEGPTGSLITNGTVSGTGALWVDRHFEVAGRYQYFSVPVTNGSDNDFDNTNLPNSFNSNLYTYDETYDATTDPVGTSYDNWSNPTYGYYDAWIQIAVDLSDELMDGSLAKGYVTYNETEFMVNFGGSPSDLNNETFYNAPVTYTLNDANLGYYDGWNIVGNPYPCALDAHALSLSNIDSTIYYWDGDAGNYKYYNFGDPTQLDIPSSVVNGGSRYIPAMQAFSVKANNNAPGLVINNSDRAHDDQQMFKSSSKEFNTQYIKLRTDVNGAFDETVVRFISGANTEFDNAYDAYKMFPRTNDNPTIFSLIVNPEIPIAINTLPVSDIGTTVPLGYNIAAPGSYSISVEDFNFGLDTEVKLIDSYLDTETILAQDVEYSFNFDGGENRDRFYLFVGKTSGTDIVENDLNKEVRVWSGHDKVFVTFGSYELIEAQVKIVDVLGKTVIHKNISGTYNIIQVPGASGTYFVNVKTKDGKNHLEKVFIQK